MPLQELKEYVGPRQAMDRDLRAKLDRLMEDRRYALVAVEGIGSGME